MSAIMPVRNSAQAILTYYADLRRYLVGFQLVVTRVDFRVVCFLDWALIHFSDVVRCLHLSDATL